jgi:hypothetical protein
MPEQAKPESDESGAIRTISGKHVVREESTIERAARDAYFVATMSGAAETKDGLVYALTGSVAAITLQRNPSRRQRLLRQPVPFVIGSHA